MQRFRFHRTNDPGPGSRRSARMTDRVLTVTDESFANDIENSRGLAMVDFWATWCGPCRIVSPIVDQLADEYGDRGVTVGKVDVDTNPGHLRPLRGALDPEYSLLQGRQARRHRGRRRSEGPSRGEDRGAPVVSKRTRSIAARAGWRSSTSSAPPSGTSPTSRGARPGSWARWSGSSRRTRAGPGRLLQHFGVAHAPHLPASAQ